MSIQNNTAQPHFGSYRPLTSAAREAVFRAFPEFKPSNGLMHRIRANVLPSPSSELSAGDVLAITSGRAVTQNAQVDITKVMGIPGVSVDLMPADSGVALAAEHALDRETNDSPLTFLVHHGDTTHFVSGERASELWTAANGGNVISSYHPLDPGLYRVNSPRGQFYARPVTLASGEHQIQIIPASTIGNIRTKSELPSEVAIGAINIDK